MKKRNEEKIEPKIAAPGLASRMARHNEVYKKTRDPRAAIRAYCSGNKWLTENAKAVGNWQKGVFDNERGT